MSVPEGSYPLLQVDPATGIAEYRIPGSPGLVEITELVGEAIAECRRRGLDRLLVDTTGVRDVPIPSLHDRFLIVEEWAARAIGGMRIAVVAADRFIDPRKFGVKAAAHFGLEGDVFSDAAAARAWLARATG